MAQIDAQTLLRLAEEAGRLCFFDLEATGLNGDYNSILLGSIKPWNRLPVTFQVERPGRDARVVRQIRDRLSYFDVWVSYYGKGFDVPMLQSRLLYASAKPLEKHHHVDLYFSVVGAVGKIKPSRKSQAHALRWLRTPQQKMDMSPEEWNNVLAYPHKYLAKMRRRCESDVEGLAALYRRVKHLIQEVTR